MALIEINRDPSRTELVVFAALLPAFLGVVGFVLHRLGLAGAARALWIAAPFVLAAGLLLAWVAPGALRLLYLAWMHAALPIGWTVSMAVMVACFYLVLTPIGLVLRALGRDPLERRFDRNAASYWVRRETTDGFGRYFRQF